MRPTLLFACVIGLMTSAHAEMRNLNEGGFSVVLETETKAPPDRAYAALHDIAKWWNPAHTFSGESRNLSLDLRAGACFCETLPNGGSVEHLHVVYADPPTSLRLVGALGPLQQDGVAGAITFSFAPVDNGTRISVLYSVGGHFGDSPQKWAPIVNRVLTDQLERLGHYAEGGAP